MVASPTSETQRGIRRTTGRLSFANRWDHILARVGYRRGAHRVEPGLYALGNPTPAAPVAVTANYTLSFDAVRFSLDGLDAYILVLNTDGVNVWCAAGKGTFGTDELVHGIEEARLSEIVDHRIVIVPQLGAPGVAAHEVKKRSSFKVEYGPVRAEDLPEYLKTGHATSEMRRVRFGLRDRLVLIPVEAVQILLPMLVAAAVVFFFGGPMASAAVIAAVLAGVVLLPLLLPWIPTRDLSAKGFILGGVVAFPFAMTAFSANPGSIWWTRVASALTMLLLLPPVTAYLGLKFTGATTFTSRTGVRREIFTYVPTMAWLFGAGLVLRIALLVWQV